MVIDPLNPTPPPQRSYRWVFIVVGVLALVAIGCCVSFFLFGAYLNLTEGTSTPRPADAATETPFTLFDNGNDGSSRSKAAPLGTVLVTDDMAFKITDVTDPADQVVLDASEYNSTPDPGKRYVMVSLEVVCQAEKCSFNEYDTTLVGSEGIARDTTYITDLKDALESTDFFEGARLKGNLVFTMGADETDLVLIYSPFLASDIYLALK